MSSILDRLRSWPVHRIGFGVGAILALLVIGPGFGKGGVEQIIEIKLTAEENEALQKSAAAVKELTTVIGV